MSPAHLAADPRAGPLRVVVAADHALMRRSLRRLLEGSAGIEVAAEAGDLALARQHVIGHRPDVLVLDLDMRDGPSTPAVRDLREEAPYTHIVVVSLEEAPGFAERVLAAGASGYVSKERADVQLADAVTAAARGERYVSTTLARARRAHTTAR